MKPGDREPADKPLEKGGDNDCSTGPVKQRGCTDFLCCIVFLAHWFAFFVLMIWGFTTGNPGRLVAQRDYKGAYCGYKDNFEPWSTTKNGRRYDMDGFKKVINTMNVDEMVQQGGVAKAILCGAAAVQTGLSDYSSVCSGASELDAAKTSAGGFSDPSQAVAKLTSGSPSPLEQVSKFFHNVCVKDCDEASAFGLSYSTQVNATASRVYRFHPKPTSELYPLAQELWNLDVADNLAPAAAAALAPLKFYAMPTTLCPEDPMYCVAYPGLDYSDVANYCIFKVGAAAASAAGAAAADAASGALTSGAGEAVTGDLGTAFGDIITAWPSFIIMFFISLCVGFAFMILLRFAVGIMVWGAVFLVFALLFTGGGYFYYMSSCESKKADVAANGTTNALTYEKCQTDSESDRDMYKNISYVFFGLAGLYALLILCMCSRIMLGIAVNKVAARFMYQTKQILFVPVGQIFVAMIWWIIWLVCAMYILSSVSSEGNAFMTVPPNGPFSKKDAEGDFFTPGKCTGNYPPGGAFYDEYSAYSIADGDGTGARTSVNATTCTYAAGTKEEDYVCYRCTLPRMEIATPHFGFVFFSLLWNNAFIVAVGQCTIAGAVAIWYFTPNEEKGTRASVKPALRNCFRYHPGSLAFGAFILAVVQFVKYCLEYVKRQAEQQKNYVLMKVAAALQCVVACFERFVKFLNKNAYIQIAILGKNFCRSAWAAFCLILRNMGRIGVLATIGGMVGLIGMTFITAGTTIIGYFILIAMYEDEISSPILCTVLFAMMGYVIGKLFMNVFALAVDTTLQCFCADEELNKSGSGNNYTPEELKAFLKDPSKKKTCLCC